MWRQRFWKIAAWVLGGLQIASAVLLTIFGASLRTDAEKWKEWGIEPLIIKCQENAVVALPVLSILVAVLQFLLKWSESPRVWNAVHGIMDEFRDSVVAEKSGRPEHELRVTLYKKVFFHPHIGLRWRGWIVAVERSGESTRSGVSSFRASQNRPAEAEGIAGRAWAENRVSVINLPRIDPDKPEKTMVREYARLGCTSEQWVKKWLQSHPGQRPPTSICAIPVSVKGRRWGVLVLDTCTDLQYDEIFTKNFSMVAGILGKLLSGASS